MTAPGTPTVGVVVVRTGRPELASDAADARLGRLREELGDRLAAATVVAADGPDPFAVLADGPGTVGVLLHDDVDLAPGWCAAVLARYADPGVVGVAGRLTTGAADEGRREASRVGRLLPDGRLVHRFGADPGRDVDVDHLPWVAQTVRIDAVRAVGAHRLAGLTAPARAAVTGLRLRGAGGRLVLTPAAVGHRVPPARAGRTARQVRRDDVLQLALGLRPGDPTVRRYVWTVVRDQQSHVWRARHRLSGTRPDGSARPWHERLGAPLELAGVAVDGAGVVGGLLAAGARRAARATVAPVPRPAPPAVPAVSAAPGAHDPADPADPAGPAGAAGPEAPSGRTAPTVLVPGGQP